MFQKKIGRCGGDLEDKSKQINKMGVYAWIDDGKANCAIWKIPIARIQFCDTKINQVKVHLREIPQDPLLDIQHRLRGTGTRKIGAGTAGRPR